MSSLDVIAISFLSSILGIVVLFTGQKKFSVRTHAVLMGFSAGVMLAATFASLIQPSLKLFEEVNFEFKWSLVATTFILGAVAMELIHRQIPHEHEVRGLQGLQSRSFRRGVLISAAMAFHNLPEGLALGIGALQTDQSLVHGLLLGIAGQNFPEGAMTALALLAAGVSRRSAVFGVLFVGVVEASGAAMGLFFAPLSWLAWSLMFCGGAMIYVVSQEMIPESHSQGQERLATFSLIMGLVAFGFLTFAI